MSSYSAATTANLFIDLATYSENDGFIYGGKDSLTWFVSGVQKTNWFSYLPIILRHNGTFDFAQRDVSATVNRSGDYVLHAWFRVQIPRIVLADEDAIFADATLRWTRNLMHNVFERVNITFNELEIQEFDNFWLDFNAAFRKTASKQIGYKNMIGDISSMTTPRLKGQAVGTGGYFSCPLPFFFAEDTGVALPVAALPFNDIKINYTFRRWQDLVEVYPGTSAVGGSGGPGTGRAATVNDVFVFGESTTRPQFRDAQTGAHYAVVHADERLRMGDAPRDILIHQIQNVQYAPFTDVSTRSSFDLRFSHSIVLFCFAAQNVTLGSFNSGSSGAEWSNYTTEVGGNGQNPISYASLIYENATRLSNGADYYSLILPDLINDVIPEETGLHMWSYALKPWQSDMGSGSTNYSKLSNVSMEYDMTPAAIAAAGINTASGVAEDASGNALVYPNASGVEVEMVQRFSHILVARSWNIARVANGSIGYPTL